MLQRCDLNNDSVHIRNSGDSGYTQGSNDANSNDRNKRIAIEKGYIPMLQQLSTASTLSANEIVIDVRGLVKSYHHKAVVNEVSFSVRRGEIFGLLGPNGAGKTTTLEMIEGIRKPDQGTALLMGLDIQRQKQAAQRIIGVQLQATTLFPELRVLETLQFFRSLYPHGRDPGELLREVALEDRAKAAPQNLSGGQRQRLALAIALVNDPQVIFLDEPTAALDPQSRHMLWDIVLKLREQGKTIVITTHYMDEAQTLCDRIAIMDGGKIIALDTAAGLIDRLGARSTLDCRLQGKVLVTDVRELPGVTAVRQANERFMLYSSEMQATLIGLLAYATQHDIAIADLQVGTPTLEDVFLDLTGRSLRPEQA